MFVIHSFFYGDLERTELSFTAEPGNVSSLDNYPLQGSILIDFGQKLLLRMIDDFMFVTTKRSAAVKFLDIASRGPYTPPDSSPCILPYDVPLTGFPEYGAFISPEKSMVNFDCARSDVGRIPRAESRHGA
jgi:hypothetical protein